MEFLKDLMLKYHKNRNETRIFASNHLIAAELNTSLLNFLLAVTLGNTQGEYQGNIRL